MSVHRDWKQDVPFGESHNKRRAIINVSNSESGEPNNRPPLLWHNSHRNAFLAQERSPRGGRLAIPITRGYPLPAPPADRFARCVSLAVCTPAPVPDTPEQAVRCRGIPPRSPRGGCQPHSLLASHISSLCLPHSSVCILSCHESKPRVQDYISEITFMRVCFSRL